MRIDGYSHPQDAQATDGTRRTGADAPGRTSGPSAQPTTSPDRVELSGNAALFTAAVKAVGHTPEIRSDRVEAAREKYHAGRVGADPLALADAILKELLP